MDGDTAMYQPLSQSHQHGGTSTNTTRNGRREDTHPYMSTSTHSPIYSPSVTIDCGTQERESSPHSEDALRGGSSNNNRQQHRQFDVIEDPAKPASGSEPDNSCCSSDGVSKDHSGGGKGGASTKKTVSFWVRAATVG